MNKKMTFSAAEGAISYPGAIGNYPSATPRRLRSADLLQNCRELFIEHAGEDYRLRITSKGKLILTK